MTDPLLALARFAGIADAYHDNTGCHRQVPPETLAACLTAIGYEADSDAAAWAQVRDEEAARARRAFPAWVVAGADTVPPLHVPEETGWVLHPDGDTAREGRGALPPLPLGRHRLTIGGEDSWILSAPPALPLPPRGWGVTLPLYGLRGPERGGLGDYDDLAAAAQGLGAAGASFLGINPVHAGFGFDPFLVSPYSPSHRRFLSTRHVATDGDDGGPGGPLVDYTAALPARFAALEAAYRQARPASDPAFARFCAAGGESLRAFARYETLAERHGPSWDTWPTGLRDPHGPETKAALQGEDDRILFHMWLQFLAHEQLTRAGNAARAAGMTHGLYLDLAVGTHPFGAETWAERESFAFGVSLGAPPDAFSETGQNWSLAPFNPRRLAASGFEPLAATLRAQLRYGGMLRIDHILGFDRAFWVPDGLPGTYVSMPRDAMFAVARIEAARAGAVIVGEDLGNVPEGFREGLAATGILGCEVAMFTPDRPAGAYREAALASFGTHDLPTHAGWRQGRDIAARRSIGTLGPDDTDEALRQRSDECARLDTLTGSPDAAALHAFLARTSARLVALQAEDILDQEDQQNLPGTTSEYPNWRRRLSVDAKDLAEDPRTRATARIMTEAHR